MLFTVYRGASIKLDSTVSSAEKGAIADDFKYNKKLRLLICDLETFEVEVKLSAIGYMAFYELPWSKSQLAQYERILRRIEPKDKTNAYFLFASDSIEEKVASQLEKNIKLNSPFMVNPQSLLDDIQMEYKKS